MNDMAALTSERVQALCADAEQYYNPELPYHSWRHAEEVMANATTILDEFLGGRRRFGPAMRIDRGPILIAAAHHDDRHDHPDNAQFPSKEHYAAHLAEEALTGKIDEATLQAIRGMILATEFQVSRKTYEEKVLHYADVWGMAAPYETFLDQNVRLWQEAGRPPWEGYKKRARKVIAVTVDESLREFSPMTAVWGADPYYFPIRARNNLERFTDEPTPEL
jgi:predicted metal-dependent HD superfamily phosphohydrolase